VFAAQLGHGQPALRLPQHAHDLGFSETALLHQSFLFNFAEKILLMQPLTIGKIARSISKKVDYSLV